jgi:hypothetical protein
MNRVNRYSLQHVLFTASWGVKLYVLRVSAFVPILYVAAFLWD